MSYIAFDLDAFDAAESAARHAGASADAVMAGLLRLWRFCWRQRTDRVTRDQLRGIFGLDAGPALMAFGFVEPGDDGYRVKGADRYLRVQEGRSKGGKASVGNLKRGTKAGPTSPAVPRLAPGLSPAPLPADSRAFTDERAANSEQRAANTSAPRKRDAEKPDEKPVDPRHTPLKEKLFEAFRRKRGSDMPWTGRQGKTLQRLLDQRAREDLLWPVALLAAFERALLATHPDLKSLEDFERDLVRYVGTGPPTSGAERAGAASAKATDWSDYKPGDTARELFGGG